MPNAPTYNSNTNPNAKGGAFGYDGRTGLGIGSLTKGPASGLGSNWNMGDALSSPKGQWDDDIEDDEEEYDEFDADVELKAHMSFHRGATDSLSRRGTSIGYMGGIGSDMSAVIGLSAGHVLTGDVVSENVLREFIREAILSEYTISGNIAVRSRVKAKGTGGKRNRTVYSVDKTTSHTNKLDNSSTQKSKAIDHGGYGQRAKTPDLFPYSKSGKATTDGAETLGVEKVNLKRKKSEKAFNNGKSTYEDLVSSTKQEEEDMFNVDFRNNKLG